MTEERFDRRSLLVHGAVAGAALALPGTGALARRPRVARAGGRASLGALRQAVRGRVITAGQNGYGHAAKVYNERYDGAQPLAIVRARGVHDVQEAMRWADKRDCRVTARSGGHSHAGYSTGDGALVIDLSGMHSISVDGSGRAGIEAGAQLINVYMALADRGRTIPAGSCPSVGLGGHAQGGGMGLAGRRFGLTLDNVRAITIVTADGKRREIDRHHDQDLFWACRGGGGGNFGVVTRFELKTHPVGNAAWFSISYPWSQASEALDAWQHFAPDAPKALTALCALGTGSTEPSFRAYGQYFGAESDLPSLLSPLTAVAGAGLSKGTLSYREMMLRWAGCSSISEAACHTEGTWPGGTLPRQRFLAKSDYVSGPLPSAGREALIEAVEQRQAQSEDGSMIIDAYGGAINDVGRHATAFVHRTELCSIQYLAYYAEDAFDQAKSWITDAWASTRDHVSGRAYQNYIDPDLDDWEHAYYGSNLQRLRHVKAKYDPERRFRFKQGIRPS